MIRCKKCGTELPDGAKFCSVCGTAVSENASENVTAAETTAPEASEGAANAAAAAGAAAGMASGAVSGAGAAPQFNNNAQFNGNGQFNNGQFNNGQFNNGQFNANGQFGGPQKETSSTYYGKQSYVPAATDAEANKGVAICAYFGLLWLVPLFTAKNSPFAKFHTNQAILVFITSVVFKIAGGILNALLIWIFDYWRIYKFTTVISWATTVCGLVLMILGIVYAAQGKMKEIPVLGQFHLLK